MKPPIRSIGDVPRAVLPRRHGHRIRRRICYILFFRRLESKLVFTFLLYQFIDSIESLRPPPPPTPLPPRICAGLGVSIKSAPLVAAEAHHGGVVCGLWKREKTYYSYVENLPRVVFCSRQNGLNC
jgi:hypothetical protein